MNNGSELVGISHEQSDGTWSFSQRWFSGTAVAGPMVVILLVMGVIIGLYKLTGGVELSMETPLVALMVLPVVYGGVCINHLIAVCLNKTRLLYSRGGVQVKHGPWPSVGYTGLRIDAEMIAEFDVKDVGADTSGPYSIGACDWRGKRYELMRDIDDRHTADFMVSSLSETVDSADRAVITPERPRLGATLGRYVWSCMFFLISLLVIGYALDLRGQQKRRMESHTETDGTLVDYVSHVDDVKHKPTFRPVYEYTDKSGSAHRITSRVGSQRKDPLGSKLKLRYDPDKPDKAVLSGSFDSHPGPLILIWSWGLLALIHGARLAYVVLRR